MLKPLTLSLSLAVALGLCSVSKAGNHDNNCATCGLASPQGVVASPQGGYIGGCETPCAPKHHWSFPKICWPKLQHQVCYEWVLKKKHNWHFGGGCSTRDHGAIRRVSYVSDRGSNTASLSAIWKHWCPVDG